MRKEFDLYRAEHLELEPLPPVNYSFGTFEHVAEAGTSD